MSVYEKGLVTILLCDVLFVALAVPLVRRKVRRNPVYGFRTRATLASDDVWYDANAHFGRGLVAASVVSALAALLLSPRFPDLAPKDFLNASVVVLALPVVVAGIRTSLYLRSLRR